MHTATPQYYMNLKNCSFVLQEQKETVVECRREQRVLLQKLQQGAYDNLMKIVMPLIQVKCTCMHFKKQSLLLGNHRSLQLEILCLKLCGLLQACVSMLDCTYNTLIRLSGFFISLNLIHRPQKSPSSKWENWLSQIVAVC